MSNLLRLSDICLMEFGTTYSKKITSKELYAYRFGRNVQLLSADGDINDRDKSFCPYYQNVLLRRTPHPYFPETFHQEAALSKIVNSECPALEYNRATVNFASGWFYNTDEYLSGIRLYYIVDGVYSFTVSALIDERASSRLKANKRNIVLDSVLFNTSYDIEYLNVAQLFNSTDTEIRRIREHLFGAGDHSCSELFIEQFIVEKSQLVEFYNGVYPYTRFFVNEYNKQFYTQQDTDSQLFVSFRKDDINKCLSLQLLHTKYNVRTYLKSMLTDNDSWNISYEITTTAYNIYGNSIGSLSTVIYDFNDPFTEILFKPVILSNWVTPESGEISDKIDHCVFDVRCIAKSNIALMEIARYAQMVETNPERYFIGIPEVNMISPKLYSRREVVTHEVTVNSDLPNIVKIIQPYYVMTVVGNEIVLTPYRTNVAIPLDGIDTSRIVKLSLRIDTREYQSKEISNSKAIFVLPASEYSQKSKDWYLFDDSNNLVTYGKISRNGESK